MWHAFRLSSELKRMIRILEVGQIRLRAVAEDSRITSDEIIASTRRWLERSVIGLNLCPFAESVYRGGRVRFRVSEQRSASALLDELRAELSGLHAAEPLQCETTLLIHPWVLADFVECNDFLEVCEA